MIKKLTGLILIAGMFAVASAYAKDAACCAKTSKGSKMMCSNQYAKLNLTAEQKTKLMALQDKCNKAGCTEASRTKFLKSAKKILSAEQYAQLKVECDKASHTQKTQS